MVRNTFLIDLLLHWHTTPNRIESDWESEKKFIFSNRNLFIIIMVGGLPFHSELMFDVLPLVHHHQGKVNHSILAGELNKYTG